MHFKLNQKRCKDYCLSLKYFFSLQELLLPVLRWMRGLTHYLVLSCRMACLQSTWRRRGTTWTALSSFCSTTQRLMISHWTTLPLCMWQHIADITEWPKYYWTKGPNLTLGHWSVIDTHLHTCSEYQFNNSKVAFDLCSNDKCSFVFIEWLYSFTYRL